MWTKLRTFFVWSSIIFQNLRILPDLKNPISKMWCLKKSIFIHCIPIFFAFPWHKCFENVLFKLDRILRFENRIAHQTQKAPSVVHRCFCFHWNFLQHQRCNLIVFPSRLYLWLTLNLRTGVVVLHNFHNFQAFKNCSFFGPPKQRWPNIASCFSLSAVLTTLGSFNLDPITDTAWTLMDFKSTNLIENLDSF